MVEKTLLQPSEFFLCVNVRGRWGPGFTGGVGSGPWWSVCSIIKLQLYSMSWNYAHVYCGSMSGYTRV